MGSHHQTVSASVTNTMEKLFMRIVKNVAFVANLCVFLVAVVGLGFGIFALVDGDAIADLFAHVSEGFELHVFGIAAILIIAVSSVLLVTTFFGCCGAKLESRCLLITYAFLVSVLIACAAAVPILIVATEAVEQVKDPLMDSLKDYNPSPSTESETVLKESWDDLQNSYLCCGVDNYTDWTMNPNYSPPQANTSVPESCCNSKHGIDDSSHIQECLTDPESYAEHLPGCWPGLVTSIEAHEKDVVIVSSSVIAAMVVNLVLSIVLSCGIRQEKSNFV